MTLITCTCSNCNKEIQKHSYYIKNNKNVYCSRQCSNEHMLGKWVGDKNPRWRGGLKEKECPHCHSRFIPSVITSKFCSRECANKAKTHHTIFSCLQCGNDFSRSRAEIRQGKTKFCSLACMGKWNSEHRTGENSHGWKGGPELRPSSNPNRQSEYYHQRRAREAGCEINDFTLTQWEELLDYYHGCCAYCLKPLSVPDREHMTPISRGGNNTLDNIVPSCRSCNVRKNEKTLLEFVLAGGLERVAV